jgi:type I restriction enzyme R subunit
VKPAAPPSNFAHLAVLDAQLQRLGLLAERYFADDPNTCLIKLRQLAEVLAQLAAERVGGFLAAESQFDRLRRLEDQGLLPREIAQVFHEVRRVGNAATHEVSPDPGGDHGKALGVLKLTWQLGVWFHRTFREPAFRPGPFLPPRRPLDESDELRTELDRLRALWDADRAGQRELAERLEATALELQQAKDDQALWEQMAAEAETARRALEQRLEARQAASSPPPKQAVAELVAAAQDAAKKLEIDERATRQRIDELLRQAGWEADSERRTHARGARPEKGRDQAIAEWPTETGPADYVLFLGLRPVAAIEAKRRNVDVAGKLPQAQRYARGFLPAEGPATWGEYRLPFAFSTNGRPYLPQLATQSGIWFRDLRRPQNLARALDGWPTPEGLDILLQRDEQVADEALETTPCEFAFPLRDYQEAAIRAVEQGIAGGRRELLVAMATGTGKTKMCIALLYRLLGAQRFRRVLFLVDREFLGEQAEGAFQSTLMRELTTFADTYGVEALVPGMPESGTAVHIATVQSMVQRVFSRREDQLPPAVDTYDCIVVDECHRGYLLDREMSDAELEFRDFDDYLSKYRRVLEAFDAVKIGLTATPALHTTEIFGPPIFTYGYRDAVIDGWLVDHEPPIQIRTELSEGGIVWEPGAEIELYDLGRQQIELFQTPDEVRFDVEHFNRRVVTEAFNRVVCEQLAEELDPSSKEKTLVFCALDRHADLVVALLKDAFAKRWGAVEDDAVMKITGKADQPRALVRRFKNELLPNVAVTVDLLTTGVDVEEICNLVFLRRVGSRILFDQMLGRATRPCDEIGKSAFRIFDAVGLYAHLGQLTEMRPVAVDPRIPFAQLIRELLSVDSDTARNEVREQLLARLERRRREWGGAEAERFEADCGLSLAELVREVRTRPLDDLLVWLGQRQELGVRLDQAAEPRLGKLFISHHEDQLVAVERGYGLGTKPEDFLAAFTDFIRTHRNEIPALLTVVTRPRSLTRKALRDLARELDKAGFSEIALETAWRQATNQELAARIVGFVRQAALGDPLLPYAERVDRALRKILAEKPWTAPQRSWLLKIAAQTKANGIVDRDAIDDPDQLFRSEGGGFKRLDTLFGGELDLLLERFNDAIWTAA